MNASSMIRPKRFVCLCVLILFILPIVNGDGARIPPDYEVPERVNHLIQVALEELGNGRVRGTTKYGAWAGDPYGQWCAEFLCWCVDQTDQRYGTGMLRNHYPNYRSSNVGRAFFISNGRYVSRRGKMNSVEGGGRQWFKDADTYMEANAYIPQPGDWMFMTWLAGVNTDHVAMVEYCTREADGRIMVHVIDGNNPTVVARHVYPLDDNRILGYGTVHDIADWPLRYRDRNVKVTLLQKKLACLGLILEEECDGVFGRKTLSALNAFQLETMQWKRATGIADLETQQALNVACIQKLTNDHSGYLVTDDDE